MKNPNNSNNSRLTRLEDRVSNLYFLMKFNISLSLIIIGSILASAAGYFFAR